MIEAVKRSRRVRHRAWALVVLAGIGLAAAAWIGRTRILREAATLWVVSDPLHHADAIAVLGGGLDTRPFAAARLYAAGLADTILVANVKPSPIDKIGIIPPQTQLTRDVLMKLGVPQQAIVSFGHNVASTFDEARALAIWAKTDDAHTIIVPTEIFSTRRQRWILERELEPVGTHAIVEAISPLAYNKGNWWRHEEGVIGFQNEVIKYLYYRLKH